MAQIIFPDALTNQVQTTLSAAITSTSATSISVTSATGMPSPQQFRILVDTELMLVTAISGTTLTVVRGVEGTTAATHSNAAPVILPATAKSVQQSLSYADLYGNRYVGKRYVGKQEYLSLPAATELTLLNYTSGAGVIDRMWIAINSGTADVREQSVLNVYVDGEATASFSFPIGNGVCRPWANGPLVSKYIGWGLSSSNNQSYYFNFRWPFNTSVKVTLHNTDVSNTGTVFCNIEYQAFPSGVTVNWGRCGKLCATQQTLTSIAALANYTMLNYSSGPGMLVGFATHIDGQVSNVSWLEGDVTMTVDGEGSPSIVYSGTEDYYGNGDYFNSLGIPCASDQFGITEGSINLSSNSRYSMYRFHIDQPITWDSSIVVQGAAGQANQPSVGTDYSNGGTYTISGTVVAYYYTQSQANLQS